MVKLCNDKLVLEIPTLLIKNIINEKLHKLHTGKISSFTNQPLQKHLGYIPNIALNIFFVVELHQNSIQNFIRDENEQNIHPSVLLCLIYEQAFSL